MTEGAPEPRNWLIYDQRSECYWGPNRGGYFKSIASAGLYTEKEAREADDFAKRYGRKEVAVPLSTFGEEIRRLYDALTEREAEDLLLGPPEATPAPEHTCRRVPGFYTVGCVGCEADWVREAGERGFHACQDLYFRRMPDGAVRVLLREAREGEEGCRRMYDHEVLIPPVVWTSVVRFVGSAVKFCQTHSDPMICLACEAEEDKRPEWAVAAPPAGETARAGLPMPLPVSDAEVIAAVRGVIWEAMRGREIGGDRTLVGMVKQLVAERDEARDNRRDEYELRMEAESPQGETARERIGSVIYDVIAFLRSIVPMNNTAEDLASRLEAALRAAEGGK